MQNSMLKDMIRKHAIRHISDEEFTSDLGLIEDLGYTSLTLIRLVVDIEGALGVAVPESALVADRIGVYGRLVEIVESMERDQ